jgi:hypothetical protein
VDFALQVRLARIPASVLGMLVLPGGLVAASVASAVTLEGPVRYAAFSVLLLASAAWSILNIPDALRPYIEKLRGLLPARARSGR